MIVIFFVTVLVIQVALIVGVVLNQVFCFTPIPPIKNKNLNTGKVELMKMRIEKFSKSLVVKLFCRKSCKIHPTTSAEQTTGQNSTKNQRKWILRSWIPDKRFTPEEEEEMHDQFSFILDWILFALSSIATVQNRFRNFFWHFFRFSLI